MGICINVLVFMYGLKDCVRLGTSILELGLGMNRVGGRVVVGGCEYARIVVGVGVDVVSVV